MILGRLFASPKKDFIEILRGIDMAEKSNAKKIKNDIIFIVALVLILAIIGGLMFLFGEEGNTVVVKIDGELFGEYPLNEDRVVEIRSEHGYNIMVIKDGQVYVEDADCPGKYAWTKCTNQSPISYTWQHIWCQENMVEISINGKVEDGGLDIVS